MSGTPPREILYTDPVSYDRSEAKTKVWRTHDDHRTADVNVKAFHWGSLTSGSKITALWILLTPFVFANVSGWMQENNQNKAQIGLVRVCGLGLTGLFVAQLGVVFIGLTHILTAEDSRNGLAVGVGGLLLGISYLAIVLLLSTRSHLNELGVVDQLLLTFGTERRDLLPPEKRSLPPDSTQWADPTPGARLVDAELWDSHSILHRLRRLHLAFGLFVPALILELGFAGLSIGSWVIVGLLACCIVSSLILSADPRGFAGRACRGFVTIASSLAAGVWVGAIVRAIDVAPVVIAASVSITLLIIPLAVTKVRWHLLMPVAFGIGAIGIAAIGGGTAPGPGGWPFIHNVVFAQAAVLGIGAGLYYVWGIGGDPAEEKRSVPPGTRSPGRVIKPLIPIGALALAVFLGASLGIAVAVMSEFATTLIWDENTSFSNATMIDYDDLDEITKTALTQANIDETDYADLAEGLGADTRNSDVHCEQGGVCIDPELRWEVSRFDIKKASAVANGGAWIAVAMLGFVSGIAAVCGLLMSIGPRLRGEGKFMSLIRRVTIKADWLFVGTGLVGTVFGAMAIWDTASGGPGWNPSNLSAALDSSALQTVVGVFASLAIVMLAIGLGHVTLLGGVTVLAIGAAAIGLVWMPDLEYYFSLPVIGLPVDLLKAEELSILLMVLVPTLLIIRSIIGGIGDPASRRKVGMLWDTGSFWPRWFHPLGPTSYGPHAVKALRNQLAVERPDVLAAHSQGSVIATVTLSQGARKPNGFLTYGSPLGILYSKLFQSVGVSELAHRVECAMLDDKNDSHPGHWINLWRDTDPLGGQQIPGLEENHKMELSGDLREGSGHSQYELTKTFRGTRYEVIAGTSTEVDCG